MRTFSPRITRMRGLADAILVAAVVILVGTSGLRSSASSTGKYTISLEAMGVAFDLPRGYAILQREFIEGRYATIVTFGKEFRPGYLKYARLQIAFWPTAYDGTRGVPGYKPSQYVDVEFQRVKESRRGQPPSFGDPEYVKLFGNKTVRYTIAGLGATTTIIGYLSTSQLGGRAAKDAEEYQVRITIDDPDKESEELFNTVVNSFRSIK